MKRLAIRLKTAMIGGWAFLLVGGFALQGCAELMSELIRQAAREHARSEYLRMTPWQHSTSDMIALHKLSPEKLPLAKAFMKVSSEKDKETFDQAGRSVGFLSFTFFLADVPREATPEEVKRVRTELENKGFKF